MLQQKFNVILYLYYMLHSTSLQLANQRNCTPSRLLTEKKTLGKASGATFMFTTMLRLLLSHFPLNRYIERSDHEMKIMKTRNRECSNKAPQLYSMYISSALGSTDTSPGLSYLSWTPVQYGHAVHVQGKNFRDSRI